MKRWLTFFFLAGILSPIFGVEVPLQDFKDGTTQGWVLNNEGWAGGFSKVENANGSLHIAFAGQTRRWGAYRKNLSDSVSNWAFQFGGTLFVDVIVPANSAGMQEIGVSFEQPDISDAQNWQQTWFPIGHEGNFSLAMRVNRTGSAPPNINLGQSAPAGNFEIILTKVHFVPDPPPVKRFNFPREVSLFEFDSDVNGFEAASFASMHLESGMLSIGFNAGGRDFAAIRRNINDPGILSEIVQGGTLLVDVIIPDFSFVSEAGIALKQPDANVIDQAWAAVPPMQRTTISLPFKRQGIGPIEILIGRNSTQASNILVDHIRIRIDDFVGGQAATLAADKSGKLYFTGALENANAVEGPFHAVDASAMDFAQGKQFYRARDWVGILFQDDFEVAGDWSATALWRRVEIMGTHAWGTANDFTTGYPNSTVGSVVSPVIDLAKASAARLAFYQVLDVGSDFELDEASILVRDENGNFLGEVFHGAQRVAVHSWERREFDLPEAAMGKKVRLEFRLTTDGFGSSQAGWFIDNVRVALTP